LAKQARQNFVAVTHVISTGFNLPTFLNCLNLLRLPPKTAVITLISTYAVYLRVAACLTSLSFEPCPGAMDIVEGTGGASIAPAALPLLRRLQARTTVALAIQFAFIHDHCEMQIIRLTKTSMFYFKQYPHNFYIIIATVFMMCLQQLTKLMTDNFNVLKLTPNDYISEQTTTNPVSI